MKKHIYKILILILFASFAACDNYLINGQLDGMWQLQTIERQVPDTIIRNEGDLFYSFQRHTVLVGDYNNPNELIGHLKNEQYDCMFECIGDSIIMDEFHLYYKREHLSYDTTRLKRFGLYEKKNSFHIEKLTSKHLMLRSDSALLTLRKY